MCHRINWGLGKELETRVDKKNKKEHVKRINTKYNYMSLCGNSSKSIINSLSIHFHSPSYSCLMSPANFPLHPRSLAQFSQYCEGEGKSVCHEEKNTTISHNCCLLRIFRYPQSLLMPANLRKLLNYRGILFLGETGLYNELIDL